MIRACRGALYSGVISLALLGGCSVTSPPEGAGSPGGDGRPAGASSVTSGPSPASAVSHFSVSDIKVEDEDGSRWKFSYEFDLAHVLEEIDSKGIGPGEYFHIRAGETTYKETVENIDEDAEFEYGSDALTILIHVPKESDCFLLAEARMRSAIRTSSGGCLLRLNPGAPYLEGDFGDSAGSGPKLAPGESITFTPETAGLRDTSDDFSDVWFPVSQSPLSATEADRLLKLFNTPDSVFLEIDPNHGRRDTALLSVSSCVNGGGGGLIINVHGTPCQDMGLTSKNGTHFGQDAQL